jgi:acyl-coenzyme A thioesterase PaaI-like protein
MSSHKQGFLRNISLSANAIRLGMNLWPPFVGAGIHVESIADDFRSARVRLKLRWYNRNFFGVHFGGSLFAMTDPFFAILVMHNLPRDHVVWDRASRIHFKSPGRGTVWANFSIDQAQVDDVLAQAAGGEKYEPWFSVDVTDHAGNLVATVEKQLYVRRKPVTPG